MVTDEFLTLARTECATRGVRELPLVEVTHPVGTIPAAALKKVAESVLDAIINGLTQPNGGSEPTAVESAKSQQEAAAEMLTVPSDPAAMFHFL